MNRRRHTFDVEGFVHGAPIPVATRIDNLVFSGGISGWDPERGDMPASLEDQVAMMFRNVRRVVEAAGCTTADIAKMTVWVRDGAAKSALNAEWLAMFPDDDDRPARHTFVYELSVPMLVQCEIIAVVARRDESEGPA